MPKRDVPFRLISDDWDSEIRDARLGNSGAIKIICPFIKLKPLSRILSGNSDKIKVITRFDLNCFSQGVSDTAALRMAIEAGGRVRGVKHLHSKLYMFGIGSVIATSANVTDAAFHRNHEFGFLARHSEIVEACRGYFEDLWKRAGNDLTLADLVKWEKAIDLHQRKGSGAKGDTLPDYGTDAGTISPFTAGSTLARSENQAFIKFFGTASNRSDLDLNIPEMVAESGCNWACTYPASKPPRQVQDGDVIYMARMVSDDMRIFGKAIGQAHDDRRDVASAAEIKARPWKVGWPRYVRVHDARFIDGTLADGISFQEMLRAMQADSFASTQHNRRKGSGNLDPFGAYNRKAHMMLTPESRIWIERRLEAAMLIHGEVDLTAKRFQPPR